MVLAANVDAAPDYGTSLVKAAELRARVREDNSDSIGIRFKFDNLLDNAGAKRRGARDLRRAHKLLRDIHKSELVADFYAKVVTHRFDQELLTSQRAHLERLKKTIDSFRRREDSLFQVVKLEEERELLKASVATLEEGLSRGKTEFREAYGLSLDGVSFAPMIRPRRVGELIKAVDGRQTLLERQLQLQLTTNQHERDIKVNSSNATLSFLEIQRDLPDNQDPATHSVAVGINLPLVGDETSQLMDEVSYVEKKYKTLREINEHRLEHGQLKSLTQRNIGLLAERRAKYKTELAGLKRQAVKNLSLDDFVKVLEYEYGREQENIALEKEIFLGFVAIIKESGDILEWKNLLTGER